MLMLNWSLWIWGHSCNAWMQDFTILDLSPRHTTGNIWCGSPPNTTVIPTKGLSTCRMSHRDWSIQSTWWTWLIITSSQIISSTFFTNFAVSDWAFILQTDFSFTGIGILILECAVLSPSDNSSKKHRLNSTALHNSILYYYESCLW